MWGRVLRVLGLASDEQRPAGRERAPAMRFLWMPFRFGAQRPHQRQGTKASSAASDKDTAA